MKRKPKTIRAQVSQAMLKNSPLLFNGSLDDILIELMQNSRRAGATGVTIDSIQDTRNKKHQIITFSDNGRGIADSSIIINQAESAWDNDTLQNEDPAGMGFFCLARFGAEIRSQDWALKLTPKTFTGEETATEKILNESVPGTTIIFYYECHQTEILRSINTCGKYYPLKVRYNGKYIEQSNYLSEAKHTFEFKGVRVGIREKDITESNYQNINFHGLTLKVNLPKLSGATQRTHLVACIDVVSTRYLKLTLPQRKEVIECKFLEELREKIEIELYRYVSTLESHHLQFSDYSRARELGIELNEAEPILDYISLNSDYRHYEYSSGSLNLNSVNDKTTIILANNALTQQELVNIFVADLYNNCPYTLLQANSHYDGYSWYDSLKEISGIEYYLDGSPFMWNVNKEDIPFPESINVRLNFHNENHQTIDLDTPAIFENDWCTIYDDPDFYITKNKKGFGGKNALELDQLLMTAFFWFSDDWESDNNETQEREAFIYAQQISDRILFDSDTAQINQFTQRLSNLNYCLQQLPETIAEISIQISEKKGGQEPNTFMFNSYKLKFLNQDKSVLYEREL